MCAGRGNDQRHFIARRYKFDGRNISRHAWLFVGFGRLAIWGCPARAISIVRCFSDGALKHGDHQDGGENQKPCPKRQPSAGFGDKVPHFWSAIRPALR